MSRSESVSKSNSFGNRIASCRERTLFVDRSLILMSTFAACVVVLAMGCNSGDDSVSTVSGVATLDGDALTDCVVVFENKQERVFVTAYTDENGNFKSDKVVPGVFQVSVKPKPRYAEVKPGEKVIEIPKDYQLSSTSGLEATFKLGENQFDVTLTE